METTIPPQLRGPKMKRGPKPRGILKVPYFRRVLPEQVAQLDGVLAGMIDYRTLFVDGPGPVTTSAKGDIKALLDNIDSLEKKVKELEGQLEACRLSSDEDKFQAVLARYRDLEAKVKARESDGSW